MKRIILSCLIIFSFFFVNADNFNNKGNSQQKKTEINSGNDEIIRLLENKNFVFNATDMQPRGLGNVSLGSDFDVKVKNNIIKTYLPYIGTTYNYVPGLENSGFNINQPFKSYSYKKKKKKHKVFIDVNTGANSVNFNFTITDAGLATLTVSSSDRQSISYFGTINKIESF